MPRSGTAWWSITRWVGYPVRSAPSSGPVRRHSGHWSTSAVVSAHPSEAPCGTAMWRYGWWEAGCTNAPRCGRFPRMTRACPITKAESRSHRDGCWDAHRPTGRRDWSGSGSSSAGNSTAPKLLSRPADTASRRLHFGARSVRLRGTVRLHVIYENGRGVLRELLRSCGQRNWQLTELDADAHDVDSGQVGVTMTLSGTRISTAAQVLADIDGVSAVLPREDEPD